MEPNTNKIALVLFFIGLNQKLSIHSFGFQRRYRCLQYRVQLFLCRIPPWVPRGLVFSHSIAFDTSQPNGHHFNKNFYHYLLLWLILKSCLCHQWSYLVTLSSDGLSVSLFVFSWSFCYPLLPSACTDFDTLLLVMTTIQFLLWFFKLQQKFWNFLI